MDTITIVNTEARLHVLPTPRKRKKGGATTVGVVLRPGANEVEADLMAEILTQGGSASAQVQALIDRGILREQTDHDRHPVNKSALKAALAGVSKSKDVDELTRIRLNDTRAEVREAVDARLAELTKRQQ